MENKIIKFGYGTVLISSDSYDKKIIFKVIEPPKEVGSFPKPDTYNIINTIEIKIETKKYIEMSEQIKKVKNHEESEIIIDNVVLDFKNYNEKSINILSENLKNAYSIDDDYYLAC